MIKVQVQGITDTMEQQTNIFDVLITLKSKPKPNRTQYLWANAVIIDDEDARCPVIEG